MYESICYGNSLCLYGQADGERYDRWIDMSQPTGSVSLGNSTLHMHYLVSHPTSGGDPFSKQEAQVDTGQLTCRGHVAKRVQREDPSPDPCDPGAALPTLLPPSFLSGSHGPSHVSHEQPDKRPQMP